MALINDDERIWEFLKDNSGWFAEHMRNLNQLHFSIAHATLLSFENSIAGMEYVGSYLNRQQWPVNLEEIGLIVNKPDGDLEKWVFSKKITLVNEYSCAVCYLELKSTPNDLGSRFLDHAPTCGTTKPQEFAHNVKCIDSQSIEMHDEDEEVGDDVYNDADDDTYDNIDDDTDDDTDVDMDDDDEDNIDDSSE